MGSTFFKDFFEPFAIKKEQENFGDIMQAVRDGIVLRGTNLWVLAFAIILASIGLNINSAVVLIGAMLISPLMGPIIGIGVGVAINDSPLVKRSLHNILFAIAVCICASALYFRISPIGDAYSELLARTSPTIWDVLIAFFGGLAAIIGITSQKKGNIIPGAAIATSLMPPLCTVGYGLATLRTEFIFGALYLFFINAVFIAVSAILMARILRFPYREFPDDIERKRSRNIIIVIVLLTCIPSAYFGYQQIQENQFISSTNAFIENESQFPDDYLLKRTIDAKNQHITLIYGGKMITDEQISALQERLANYGLEDATLEIKQGFASLYETTKTEPTANQKQQSRIDELTSALAQKESELTTIEKTKNAQNAKNQNIFEEAQIILPKIESLMIAQDVTHSTLGTKNLTIVYVESNADFTEDEAYMFKNWLKKRLDREDLELIVPIEVIPVKNIILEDEDPDAINSTGDANEETLE